MTIDLKKNLKPLICVVAGLLTLLSLFMVFSSIYQSYDGEKVTMKQTAFDAMKMGDSSIKDTVDDALDSLDESVSGGFFFVMTSLMLIFTLIASLALIALGTFSIAREQTGKKILPMIKDDLVEKISSIAVKVYFGLVAAATLFNIIACLCNTKSETIYKVELKIGLKPGFGLFFMFFVAAIAFAVYMLLELKNPNKVPKAVKPKSVCSKCGAAAHEGDKFCIKCGGEVVVQGAPAPTAPAETPMAPAAATPATETVVVTADAPANTNTEA